MAYIFKDVFIQSVKEGSRIRLKPLPGQEAKESFYVSCSRSQRARYPIGTIYKADLQLVLKTGIKPYCVLRQGFRLERAIEYYEHNLKLEKEYLYK